MYDFSIHKQSSKPQVMTKLLRKRYASGGKGAGCRVNPHLPRTKRKINLLGDLEGTARGGRGTPLSVVSRKHRCRGVNSFLELMPS